MNPWRFDGRGEWEATSDHRPNELLTYRIGVCDDGTFDVSESDSELLGGTTPLQCLPTLAAAKDWCAANETVLAFKLADA